MFYITCFEKIEINKNDWTDIGAQRTFGYYSDKATTFKAVKENWCDLFEYLYEYAVIENIPEGIHPMCEERWFFKFNQKTREFEPIEEPIEFEHLINFALG